ncbi:hypothetical protein N3K66_006062 [Trichothecium roseum]|uniref:Uncharacterized protein n=1 Tax=Trichothecium roseum TaxID=47278 RepID=A0ACC0UZR5_9HYPO|nr:hypothetical protein N3K66_006062 [Trichothecium roseum]
MEPSSGPPRPALQPLADGDPVLGASHLARFEFSDAGTKILMVEWMPEAKDAGTGETAAITTATTTTTTAAADTDADAAADANEARTTEQSQAGTQPSGGLPTVVEGEGVDTATAAAATTNTATFDSTSTAGANAHDAGAAISGPESAAWQVSWPGKSTFLPARDMDVDGDEAASSSSSSSGTNNNNNNSPRRRRIYFLLPVETPVPATVTITPPGRRDDPIRVEPLPAIFPESLVSSVTAGPRGVLHTIWAKKRLSELEREMDAEMRANAESVGLEMALAEKQWIESNFFAQPPPSSSSASAAAAAAPTSPPRSPLYGRMAEKLSGLRLATSPADLVPSANTFTGAAAGGFSQTLSPSGNDDFAVPSFTSLAGGANAAAAPISLDAALHGDAAVSAVATPPPNKPSADGDDDLFALPMSPRSPEMKMSPFSFL